MSLDKPSSPGALLGSNFPNTAKISCFVNSTFVDRVQRFHRLLSDALVMYPVGTLVVFGYKMFHHLVECALYVSRVDVVSGLES